MVGLNGPIWRIPSEKRLAGKGLLVRIQQECCRKHSFPSAAVRNVFQSFSATRNRGDTDPWFSGYLGRTAEPAPPVERPNVHRVFQTIPGPVAPVSDGGLDRESESFQAAS